MPVSKSKVGETIGACKKAVDLGRISVGVDCALEELKHFDKVKPDNATTWATNVLTKLQLKVVKLPRAMAATLDDLCFGLCPVYVCCFRLSRMKYIKVVSKRYVDRRLLSTREQKSVNLSKSIRSQLKIILTQH